VPHAHSAFCVRLRRDLGVERVEAARIHVLQPGGEHPQAAQLAPMLVRDRVVGIVRPRAVLLERAERRAGNAEAGDDPIGAVGVAGGAAQEAIEIGAAQRMALVVEAAIRGIAQIERVRPQ
jgi:hypothetical protein